MTTIHVIVETCGEDEWFLGITAAYASHENGIKALSNLKKNQPHITYKLKAVDLKDMLSETKSEDKDLIFELYGDLGSKCAYRYINGLSTKDLAACKELLGLTLMSPASLGFQEGWVNAH